MFFCFVYIIPFLKNDVALPVFVKCGVERHKLKVCATKKRHYQLEMVLYMVLGGVGRVLGVCLLGFPIYIQWVSAVDFQNHGIRGRHGKETLNRLYCEG